MKITIFCFAIALITCLPQFNRALAAEEIKVYPINVKCGQQARFGVLGLREQQNYKVVLECANLNCSENFEPIEELIQGKKAAIIEQEFDIDNACIASTQESSQAQELDPLETPAPAGKVPAAAGKYVAKLTNSENKVLATTYFYLVSPLSKSCELKTNAVGQIFKPQPFKLETNLACLYNISLINPGGVRKHVVTQFISNTRPFSYVVKADFVTVVGKYKLTALADPQCAAQLDRECKETRFEIRPTAIAPTNTNGENSERLKCVYAQGDSEGNCLQCQSGEVCASSGECVNDDQSVCNGGSTSTTESSASAQKARYGFANSAIILYTGLFLLLSMAVFAGVLIFKHIRYRINKDEQTSS